LAVWLVSAPAFGQAFVHPGCLSRTNDFARMQAKVRAGAHPWTDSWNVLVNSYYASRTNGYAGSPQPILQRGNGGGACLAADNYQYACWDAASAYQMSLCWRITGDANYAGTAITILNRWAATCTNLCGDPNVNLLCFSGYQFACAAENLRGCTNWAAADFGSFQAWMTNHWYPLAHNFLEHHDGTCDTYIWANWDLCNLDCLLAIGVLCDRRDIYNYAINYYEAGAGNGAASRVLYHLHPGYLGQCQESGRDQGHCTLDPISLGVFCEIAWNQGDDLYGWNNNTLLAVSEYVCKYNVQPLTNTVPYHTFMNCHQDLQTVPGAGWQRAAGLGFDLQSLRQSARHRRALHAGDGEATAAGRHGP
jgi:hypothetical protein